MTVSILKGDCRDVLRTLPNASVHCVVTSPPYFGLRDYGNPGQIGLEPTPDAFVAEMVAVFREVRRVLRKDGTCWLNLGDSYAGYHGNKNAEVPTSATNGWTNGTNENARTSTANRSGIKAKDLLGIPWRVAFALQADGWYLRQDIIWSKPNPMPESVRDRCTKAHEYIFLLSKNGRYWFDADAIAEQAVGPPGGNIVPTKGSDQEWMRTRRGLHLAQEKARQNGGFETRNKRSVWEVTTQPYAEAHFATFPPALIEPCILAGCPDKACAKCGAPWVRDVEIESRPNAPSCNGKYDGRGKHRTVSGGVSNDARSRIDRGYLPSCGCEISGNEMWAADMNGPYPTEPGTVLDPFGGAGTTGLVADRLGRNAILIELNPEYAAMAERRIRNDAGLFAEIG